jgi:hypothetical protein
MAWNNRTEKGIRFPLEKDIHKHSGKVNCLIQVSCQREEKNRPQETLNTFSFR